jgi:tRNA (cmo5U34)-methyltransferase
MTTESKSSVGENIVTENANWKFSGDMVDHFDGHVSKSVPFYQEGHKLVCQLADYFLEDSSVVYEVGVSTAALLGKLHARNKNSKPDVRYVGIDIEEDMIRKARERTRGIKTIELVADDAVTFDFEKADLIISYYSAQFVKPRVRQDLINRIYEALNWGGAFILFEKIRGPDARFQDIFTTLYNDFKLEQGYESTEIIEKTKSLKGILEPFSQQGNVDLLQRAGFVDITSVMQYMCFQGFLAIK